MKFTGSPESIAVCAATGVLRGAVFHALDQFRNADENEFLNRYGHLLSGEDQIARFDRLMLEGKAPVARELLAKLPPDYQPLANARLAMATKAADAVTVLRGELIS